MKFKDLSLYTDEELALSVLAGFFGDGVTRKAKLGNRYSAVQKVVNNILSTQTVNPIRNSTPLISALKEAVTKTYAEAAEELIETIEKELGK